MQDPTLELTDAISNADQEDLDAVMALNERLIEVMENYDPESELPAVEEPPEYEIPKDEPLVDDVVDESDNNQDNDEISFFEVSFENGYIKIFGLDEVQLVLSGDVRDRTITLDKDTTRSYKLTGEGYGYVQINNEKFVY